MPWKPNKPCAIHGCPVLAPAGHAYCAEHEAQRQKRVDENRTSQSRKNYGYKWQNYSKRYLKLNEYCIKCPNKSEVVDHIIPVESGGSMWDPLNHQPMCKSCHSRKTASEDGGFGNIKRKGEGV